MRLTEHHVKRVHREIADPGLQLVDGFRPATDDDYANDVARMLATMPADGFWLFGYGTGGSASAGTIAIGVAATPRG